MAKILNFDSPKHSEFNPEQLHELAHAAYESRDLGILNGIANIAFNATFDQAPRRGEIHEGFADVYFVTEQYVDKLQD